MLHHLRRTIGWRLRMIEPNVTESSHLDKAGIPTLPVLRSFIVWRKSLLLVALPSLFLSCILGWFGVADLPYEALNFLGKVSFIMPFFAPTVTFISSTCALYWWKSPRISRRALSIGVVASLALPLWPALFPVDILIKDEYIVDLAVKLGYGILYQIQLVPLIVTVPGGLIRGALRTRGLLPETSLAGWFIVLAAPLYSLIIFGAFIFISQVLGNGLLLAGSLLLVLSPLLYILRYQLYVASTSEETEKQLVMVQKANAVMGVKGLLLILIWMFTYKVDVLDEDGEKVGIIRIIGKSDDYTVAFIDVATGIRLVFESIGRILIMGLFFCDLTLRMTLKDWSATKKRLENTNVDVDAMLEVMREGLRTGSTHGMGSTHGKDKVSPHKRSKAVESSVEEEGHDEDESEASSVSDSEYESESFVEIIDLEKGPAAAPGHYQEPTVERVEEIIDGQLRVTTTTTYADGSRSVVEEYF